MAAISVSASNVIDQQLSGIASAQARMMPGCDVSVEVVDRVSFERNHPSAHFPAGAGHIFDEQEVILWVALPDEMVGVFTVTRGFIPFSPAEKELMTCLPPILRDLPFTVDPERTRRAQLVANMNAFQEMLITQYLWKGPLHAHSSWTPGLIIDQLLELVFQDHEGRPATSGFMVAAHPLEILRQLESSCYDFDPFPREVVLDKQFFEHPTATTYVDGKDSFYLIDHDRRIRGVIYCAKPDRYDRIGRAAHEHLEPLWQDEAADAWFGYIGNNNDVNLIASKNKHLRWLQSHWHFVDQYHLQHALRQQGFAEAEIPHFVALLLAVSDRREGALVLIPNHRNNRPETVRHVDDSTIGHSLVQMLIGEKVSQLRRRPSILGMFATDGLTTIDRSGRVLGWGDIIRVKGGDGNQQPAGGGRTQAALSASRYGLAIKISQDGPITFFKNGQEQLHIVF